MIQVVRVSYEVLSFPSLDFFFKGCRPLGRRRRNKTETEKQFQNEQKHFIIFHFFLSKQKFFQKLFFFELKKNVFLSAAADSGKEPR
jgi:hypothetical protein